MHRFSKALKSAVQQVRFFTRSCHRLLCLLSPFSGSARSSVNEWNILVCFFREDTCLYIFWVSKFELCISIGNIQTIHQATLVTPKGSYKKQIPVFALCCSCSCFTGSKPAASAGSWPQDHPKRVSSWKKPWKKPKQRGRAAFDAPWRKQFRDPRR